MAIGKTKIKYDDQRLFLFDSANSARFAPDRLLTITTNGGSVSVEVWNGVGTGDPDVDAEWEEDSAGSPIVVDSNVVVYTGGLKIRVTPAGGATYIWGG